MLIERKLGRQAPVDAFCIHDQGRCFTRTACGGINVVQVVGLIEVYYRVVDGQTLGTMYRRRVSPPEPNAAGGIREHGWVERQPPAGDLRL